MLHRSTPIFTHLEDTKQAITFDTTVNSNSAALRSHLQRLFYPPTTIHTITSKSEPPAAFIPPTGPLYERRKVPHPHEPTTQCNSFTVAPTSDPTAITNAPHQLAKMAVDDILKHGTIPNDEATYPRPQQTFDRPTTHSLTQHSTYRLLTTLVPPIHSTSQHTRTHSDISNRCHKNRPTSQAFYFKDSLRPP